MGRVVVVAVVVISSDADADASASAEKTAGRGRGRRRRAAVAGVAAQAEVAAGIVARGQGVVRILRGAAMIQKLVVHCKCFFNGLMDGWMEEMGGLQER